MKFNIIFENSGDTIPLEIVANQELLEFFVAAANSKSNNLFSNNKKLFNDANKKLNDINWALSKVNEVIYLLTGNSFTQQNFIENYFDQDFLNKTHADWVFSQSKLIDIDKLRFSNKSDIALIGNKLHELYPDNIRIIKLAEALDKLGYFYPYEEVNLSVHRLESLFTSNLEFSADIKWDVINNPFADTMVSNNNITNFCFGYTYVGRQYYNKFQYFDTELKYQDHYNYETLEFSFQLNLSRPQTIPFSKEFLEWTKKQNIPTITTQLPIGNIFSLEDNLLEYRKLLYRNSRDDNRASIILI